MNIIQRYELIRPILKGEKKPKQISEEKNVPLSNIYRYLKRLRDGGLPSSDPERELRRSDES